MAMYLAYYYCVTMNGANALLLRQTEQVYYAVCVGGLFINAPLFSCIALHRLLCSMIQNYEFRNKGKQTSLTWDLRSSWLLTLKDTVWDVTALLVKGNGGDKSGHGLNEAPQYYGMRSRGVAPRILSCSVD
jgi:hypothetical protein